jgi:3-deoxy-7-phosphoheptulonate synthase
MSMTPITTKSTNVKDLHVRELAPLPSPRALRNALPASAASTETVARSREAIRRILRGEDPRLLVIVGPCSIHDPVAALDYAQRLRKAADRFGDRLLLVMRTYFEKPRTTIGWRGLVNDPHLDGSFDMATGLHLARELMETITGMGLPVATEMLDPITPQYFADLVSFAAIGARTTESQTHRALASGLSMPVGFKNGTDGGVQVAVDALISAGHPHSFLGVGEDGQCCVVKTDGNPDTVVILRGGKCSGPNYDEASVCSAAEQVRRAGSERKHALLVDCSHANSGYDPCAQKEVWRNVVEQRARGRRALAGLMAESNLLPGKQSLGPAPAMLRYGVSVTDACLGWDDTLALVEETHRMLGEPTLLPLRVPVTV